MYGRDRVRVVVLVVVLVVGEEHRVRIEDHE
jgi:hypothetical protein